MKTRWISWIASGLIASGQIFSPIAKADASSLVQIFPVLAGVQLTSTQESQLESLVEQTLPQVQSLLTTEQQAQFNSSLAEGRGVRASALALNLSPRQRLQLVNLLQPLRSQITSVLTPAQLQQVQQNFQP